MVATLNNLQARLRVKLGGSLMPLEVCFARKNLVATVYFTWPRACFRFLLGRDLLLVRLVFVPGLVWHHQPQRSGEWVAELSYGQFRTHRWLHSHFGHIGKCSG